MSKLLPSNTIEKVKITLQKSTIGCTARQISSVKGLGLRKRLSHVIVANTPENRGMMNAVIFLLKIEEA